MERRIEGEQFFREARIDRDALGTRVAGEDRIPIAISSESPVERWFGLEILVHDRTALDMGRLEKRGLPLLADHDTVRQIGRVEDITLGKDRVLRGLVRFSTSAEAQQKRQDMLDAISPDISVGYMIEHADLAETDKQGGDTFRVSRWRPMEVSSVAVPADETVGVGRAADTSTDQRESPAAIVTARERAAQERTMEQETQDALTGERERISELETVAMKHQMGDEWRKRAVASGMSMEAARAEVIAMYERKSAAAEGTRNPDDITLSGKEQREYSLREAINSMLEGKREGLAFEISDELAKKNSGYNGGLLIPARLPVRRRGLETRTGVVGTASLGGNLKFTEEGDFIEALRNQLIIGQLGGRIFNGLVGNVGLPKQLTTSTAYWLAEAGTVTNADMTYGLVTLQPRILMFSAGVTRQLLAQSSLDVEMMIREDFLACQARELDRVLLVGTTTSNEPDGIFNTASVGAVTIGSNGGPITWAKVTALEATVPQATGIMDETAAYLTNYKEANDLKNIFKSTAGYMPIWENGDRPLNGYRCLRSVTVPSNLTKGTSTTICSALVFIGSAREILLGFWNGGGVAEVLVDPYSAKKTGVVELTGYSMADIKFRHAESFAVDKDLTTTL